MCRYTSFSDRCAQGRISESLNTNKPDFVIRLVDRSHDATLQNLFEHYLHDMAEWFQFDYAPDGRYAHDPAIYRNNGAEVWFAYVGEIPIAFAVVGSAQAFIDDADAKDLDEFFVQPAAPHRCIVRLATPKILITQRFAEVTPRPGLAPHVR